MIKLRKPQTSGNGFLNRSFRDGTAIVLYARRGGRCRVYGRAAVGIKGTGRSRSGVKAREDFGRNLT